MNRDGRLRKYICDVFLKHVSYTAGNFAHLVQARLLPLSRVRYFIEQQDSNFVFLVEKKLRYRSV